MISSVRRRLGILAALGAIVVLAGCSSDDPYTTLEPEGAPAREIDNLFNWVWWAATFVFVVVFVALAVVIVKFRSKPDENGEWDNDEPLSEQTHGNPLVEVGSLVGSGVILAALAVPTFLLVFDLANWHDDNDAQVEIEVYGAQWWWEFRYELEDGREFTTANTIVFPAGEAIELTMTSYDVIHSFWLPTLNGKRDVAPGRIHTWSIESDEPGVHWGQCVEFCGLSHANMRIRAIALERPAYEAWLEEQAAEKLPPAEDDSYLQTTRWQITPSVTPELAEEGYTLFGTYCASCHVVEGQYTAAEGVAPLVNGHAPNLTNFMTRTGLAANIYDLYNPDGSVNLVDLRAWIWNAPEQKAMAPDDLRGMPSFAEQLTRDDVTAIAAYLMTLGNEPTLPDGVTLDDQFVLRNIDR